MPADQPFNTYREQLRVSFPHHGLALWDPNPVKGLFKDPGHVSIGDVGYLHNGTFMRMFNVKRPRDDPSNTLIEIPEGYKPLKQEKYEYIYRSTRSTAFPEGEYYTPHVSKVDNVRANTHEE
jgi:hypothetical protein